MISQLTNLSITHKPFKAFKTSKLLVLSSVAIAITSCGSSSLASSKSTTTTTTTTQASFQACLVAHGYTFPKYNPNSKASPTTVPASVRRAALAACSNGTTKHKFHLSATQRAAFQKYASCLEAHGVAIPTTTTAANKTSAGTREPNLKLLRQSPAFSTANKACASLKPQFSGRKAGGRFVQATTTTVAGG